ncbi:hypothetical protein TWF506_001256 [Arthrobotrys conoides]|uniref:Uncharacterized protein n=1 Tax=Arthrobotrys conoides TaxID=74498 RepID=A0AAN8NMF7_9PEZI
MHQQTLTLTPPLNNKPKDDGKFEEVGIFDIDGCSTISGLPAGQVAIEWERTGVTVYHCTTCTVVLSDSNRYTSIYWCDINQELEPELRLRSQRGPLVCLQYNGTAIIYGGGFNGSIFPVGPGPQP